jgi:hypothetical protein
MADSATHIVTVFRNRLRDGAEKAYGELSPHISELAQAMDGFIDAKTFVNQQTHNAWRDHPEHQAAQQRGMDEFYETYSIQVATVAYSHSFVSPGTSQ